MLLKEIRFHIAKQIIEFCSCAKFATSPDISSWTVFTKRGDEKRSVCGDPPYCGYQTGTCRTCGSRNSPRAALHLSSTCRVSNYPARHECRSPDRPHNARVCDPCAYMTVRERGWRRSCGTTGALYPLTLRACEREPSYIGKNEKRAKPREGGNWSAPYLCRPSRKRPEKNRRKITGCSKQLLEGGCSAR